MAASGSERERLVELAQENKTSLAALSAMLGRNSSYLQQYVRKGSPRRLEEQDRGRLARFFGVSETELGAGAGHVDAHGEAGFVEVPRLPLDASAGPGSFSSEEISFDVFRFSKRWLRDMGLEGADLSAIRVEGDSMEPLLRPGDEIFVDRNKRAGEGVFVIRIGDVLHVKKIQASAPGRLTLLSQNLVYPPVEVSAAEVEIVGRVVWKGGRI